MPRIFSNGIIVNCDDYIKRKKELAKRNFTIMRGVEACIPPRTLLQGATSYICFDELVNKDITMTRKLYPYGLVRQNSYKKDEVVYYTRDCDCPT